jgi:acyl-CoA dehydrogenase
MDLSLTEEQKQIKVLVKDFCQQEVDMPSLQGKIAETTKARTVDEIKAAFPYDLLKKMDEVGLRQLSIPGKYGGTATEDEPNMTLVLAAEEFGYWGGGIGDIVVIPWFFIRAVATNYYVSDAQKEWIFSQYTANPAMMVAVTASEPAGSTDVHLPYDEGGSKIVQVFAQKDGNDWIINGDKMYSSGRAVADMVLAFTRTDKTAPASQAMTVFWLPGSAPGITVTPNITTIQELGGNCQTNYDNVRVPDANLVGEINKGYSILESVFELKFYAVAEFVGAVQKLYEIMREFASQRVGGGKPIIEHTSIASKLGDIAIDIEMLRDLVRRTAWEIDQLEKEGPRPLRESKKFSSIACYARMKQLSWKFCQVAADVYGGICASVDLPFEGFLRNIFLRSSAGLTLDVELAEAGRHYDNRVKKD